MIEYESQACVFGLGIEGEVQSSQSPNQRAPLQTRPASLQFDKPPPSP
jgi:hypothetical protein